MAPSPHLDVSPSMHRDGTSNSEISSIRQAKEQQAAEARRQATPVVGDLKPLVDALPELCQLVGQPAALGSRRKMRKNKTYVSAQRA
ncbi:hypothetical protein GOODEAATRI_027446 [Goodea atripinnis]|uniref:Uncharacterized protein n=1 Tax=Goodea atripinnis TaxID=208336 RepID=A0ABV0Q294_9TELE